MRRLAARGQPSLNQDDVRVSPSCLAAGTGRVLLLQSESRHHWPYARWPSRSGVVAMSDGKIGASARPIKASPTKLSVLVMLSQIR